MLAMRAPAGGGVDRLVLTSHELELAQMLDDAAMAMHWVGPDGTILWANEAELAMLGYRREEYVGRPITDFHVDEDVIADILRRLRAGETLSSTPARLRTKDGALRHVLIDSNAMFVDGQFRHTRCFTRDITEHERLTASETQARRRAEEQAARLALLAGASAAFSEASFDPESLCEAIASNFIVEGFADACGVLLVNDERTHLVPVVVRAHDPDVERASRELLATSPVPMGEGVSGRVAETGKPALLPHIDVEQLIAGTDPAYHEAIRHHGARSLLVVPIASEATVIGVLAAVRLDAERSFDSDDQMLASDVADRAAQAFAKARAFEAERAARARLTRLHELIEVLSERTSVEEIAAATVRQGCETAKATTGLVYRLDDDGVLRLAAQQGVPESFLARMSAIEPDSDLPGAIAVRTNQPIWIENQDQYRERFPELASRAAQSGRAPAFAAVPMRVGDRTLGVLAFGYMKPHRFTTEERAFLSLVAHHAGYAIGRAALIESIESAARRSEEANRLKDVFLATVSHELRTPLSAILGWAQILSGPRGGDPSIVAKGAEVIERNGRAQLRLIEDILDVSRIVLGKLQLESTSVDLVSLTQQVLEGLAPAAETKEIVVSFTSSPPCRVVGDGDRLRQVVWNLVSNAIKFTGRGGNVMVDVRYEDDRVWLRVSDSGCGIEPEFLPHVFDRFRQEDGRSSRDHGGLGLGLAIARHLVELHGGEVQVASDGRLQGATFSVWLPVVADHVATRS